MRPILTGLFREVLGLGGEHIITMDPNKMIDIGELSICGGGRFRELAYYYNGIAWVILRDPNKAINIKEWSICGGGRFERFYCK